ncbi:transglycosylase SLT domain-containing protein [Yersinia enterocolitica]|uniref:transglycosylase SLT domain-containing protein n=1 Tax=Yersinia enterocolitica TaxID=630 RepID=UPI00289B9EB2|nr:transglycosylase SLT domain-containing protein [Yersinia enterocolitica]
MLQHKRLIALSNAAQCFQINPLLIKAIIWQESRNRQQAMNRNINSTIDVDIMQINTVHFKALKSLGIDECFVTR